LVLRIGAGGLARVDDVRRCFDMGPARDALRLLSRCRRRHFGVELGLGGLDGFGLSAAGLKPRFAGLEDRVVLRVQVIAVASGSVLDLLLRFLLALHLGGALGGGRLTSGPCRSAVLGRAPALATAR
jgi:hypothetical protein